MTSTVQQVRFNDKTLLRLVYAMEGIFLISTCIFFTHVPAEHRLGRVQTFEVLLTIAFYASALFLIVASFRLKRTHGVLALWIRLSVFAVFVLALLFPRL